MPDKSSLRLGEQDAGPTPPARLDRAAPRLVHELVYQVLYTAIAPPGLEQLAFADFLGRGELDRHLRRMRCSTGAGDELIRSLERELPEVEVRGIAAGLYVAAVLPRGIDEARVLEEARARGIGIYGMSEHWRQRAARADAADRLRGVGRSDDSGRREEAG